MMKRTMGGVLAAAMMMMSALPVAGAVDVSHLNGMSSSTLTQAAADMLPSLSVAPMTELATVVSYENGDLTVKTADGDELVLHTENAIVMDTQTAAAADLSALKAGESVYVYHDEAVTMSLPAQTTAYAVLTNLTDKHAPASLLTAGCSEERRRLCHRYLPERRAAPYHREGRERSAVHDPQHRNR